MKVGGAPKVNEVVYAMWDVAWGEHWFLYELGETDSWKTLALGRGDSATEALTRALKELLTLAGEEAA